MSNKRTHSHLASQRIAFCGMLIALSVALMLTSSVIPIMTYAAPMICGIFLIPVELEFNRRTAYLVYFATAVITLILGFDKELALFYLFFGYYPIIKWQIEKIPGNKYRRIGLKILFFSVSLVLMFALLTAILGVAAVLADFEEMGRWVSILFFILMVACLMFFDHLLNPITLLYVTRFQSKVRKHLKR